MVKFLGSLKARALRSNDQLCSCAAPKILADYIFFLGNKVCFTYFPRVYLMIPALASAGIFCQQEKREDF
jgi:hypothetical protein